jgi:hypothetical protein
VGSFFIGFCFERPSAGVTLFFFGERTPPCNE